MLITDVGPASLFRNVACSPSPTVLLLFFVFLIWGNSYPILFISLAVLSLVMACRILHCGAWTL